LLSNRYAIFKTKLFDNNNVVIVCANSNFKTSFINKLLLLKDVNLYKRLNTILLVIVQDIVDKKIIDKQMHLSIYIIDANKVVLEARLYVTKDIKAGVILDNNILELSQNKISLYLYSKQIQIDCI